MSEPWRWVFAARARRDFKRLDPPVQRRIVAALDRLTDQPPVGDTVKLAGGNEWRLRVGDWRVRFIRDRERRVVQVLRALPRGRASATDGESGTRSGACEVGEPCPEMCPEPPRFHVI